MTKEFEITKIGVEKGIDLRLDIQDSLLPNLVLQGSSSNIECCVIKWMTSIAYLK
jgi:hypothetical protein